MLAQTFTLKSFLSSLIKSAFFTLLIAPIYVFAQYQGSPVTQERLEMVLRTKQASTGEIVETIRKKGVNFQLNEAVESRLTAAGARPQLIEAVRQNFRRDPDVPTVAANNSQTTTNTGESKTFSGAPLTKDAVMVLLQNGVSNAKVQQNIKGRGVNFQMNPDIAKELKAAGGDDALIGTIFAAYIAPANSETGNASPTNNVASNVSNNVAGDAGDAYDNLINRALDSYRTSTGMDSPGVQQATQILQQAVALNSNDPRAYQTLGYLKLYGVNSNNYSEVEGFFNKAIALGGNAVVRVYHDHDGVFTDICEGTLYISKTTVRFESDNNVHTFETSKDNIQQVKTNNPFKQMMQQKQGSYKIVLKSDDKDGVKFSFAPMTANLLESKMVVRLVGKNQ